MLLEVFSEEGLVGEMEFLGNLEYRQVGRLEQGFGFEYDVVVDPLAGRFSRQLLDYVRQVLRRQAELVGVERYAPLLLIVLADRAYEQLEELVLSSLGLWTDRLVLIEYVGYVEEKRMKQRQGDLTLVTVAFLPHFLPEERVVLQYPDDFVRIQAQARIVLESQKNGQELLDSQQRVFDEIGRYGECATGKIVALAVSLDDLPGHQNEHVVGTERVFLEVDAGAGLSAETQGEHGQIDPARIFENRNSAEVVEHGQIVADRFDVLPGFRIDRRQVEARDVVLFHGYDVEFRTNLTNKFRLSDDNLTNRIFLQEYGTVRRLYIRGSLSKFAFDAGRFFCNKSRFRVRESDAFRGTAKPRFRAWPKFVA